jgi:hypothetical protein
MKLFFFLIIKKIKKMNKPNLINQIDEKIIQSYINDINKMNDKIFDNKSKVGIYNDILSELKSKYNNNNSIESTKKKVNEIKTKLQIENPELNNFIPDNFISSNRTINQEKKTKKRKNHLREINDKRESKRKALSHIRETKIESFEIPNFSFNQPIQSNISIQPILPSQPNIPILPSQPNIPILPSQPNIPILPSQPNIPIQPRIPSKPNEKPSNPNEKTNEQSDDQDNASNEKDKEEREGEDKMKKDNELEEEMGILVVEDFLRLIKIWKKDISFRPLQYIKNSEEVTKYLSSMSLKDCEDVDKNLSKFISNLTELKTDYLKEPYNPNKKTKLSSNIDDTLKKIQMKFGSSIVEEEDNDTISKYNSLNNLDEFHTSVSYVRSILNECKEIILENEKYKNKNENIKDVPLLKASYVDSEMVPPDLAKGECACLGCRSDQKKLNEKNSCWGYILGGITLKSFEFPKEKSLPNEEKPRRFCVVCQLVYTTLSYLYYSITDILCEEIVQLFGFLCDVYDGIKSSKCISSKIFHGVVQPTPEFEVSMLIRVKNKKKMSDGKFYDGFTFSKSLLF